MRELRRPNRTDAVQTSMALAAVEEIKKSVNPPPTTLTIAITEQEPRVSPAKSTSLAPLAFFNAIKLLKALSAPDIEFLTVVIEKTNFGAESEVKIPRDDFKSPSLHTEILKATREKLEDYGYIKATKKKSGPGSEAWHYSLRLEKFSVILQ